MLDHSISSADLTAWWTGIDAGEMTLILDSCHSGAIPGKEFRPAPLGDPGFGQLSFDKGMVIFTASQSTQTAQGGWLGSDEGRTLLVETLQALAKANTEETIVDWLHEAQQRLPEIAMKLYPNLKQNDLQVPLLLDFSRETKDASTKTIF